MQKNIKTLSGVTHVFSLGVYLSLRHVAVAREVDKRLYISNIIVTTI